MVDSGVDQSSCYFREEDGSSVEFGHYFDEIALLGSSSSSVVGILDKGYYPVEAGRRKVRYER